MGCPGRCNVLTTRVALQSWIYPFRTQGIERPHHDMACCFQMYSSENMSFSDIRISRVLVLDSEVHTHHCQTGCPISSYIPNTRVLPQSPTHRLRIQAIVNPQDPHEMIPFSNIPTSRIPSYTPAKPSRRAFFDLHWARPVSVPPANIATSRIVVTTRTPPPPLAIPVENLIPPSRAGTTTRQATTPTSLSV